MKTKEELCIMPINELYSTKRFNGSARHEVYFGTKYRQKSIKLGLIVFITPEQHNVGLYGVHCRYGHDFDIELKKIGQKAYMDYYDKTIDEFIKEFGRSYIE
jgi:hypothetical protein